MKIINTDGLAFIGPGSEWFWAAAQFVVVAVTLVAIYLQLRTQAAANFMQRLETLGAYWNSPRMTHARLDLALHLRYEQADLACFYKATPILDFFADLHNLQVEGYISVKEIAANWGQSIQVWTTLTAPLVELRRQDTKRLDLYDLEPLNARLRAHERRRLGPLTLDPEARRIELDDAIRRATTALEQEAAWRSGAIPRPPESSSEVREAGG